MWKLRLWMKKRVWRFTAWMLYHQSEALRNDYLRKRSAAWQDGMAFPSFSLWVSKRVFGDEGGYRQED